MNRSEFGELIAALRQDLGWTQFQLSEYADIDNAVISQIERGVKKHFEPELLFSLANTFQLTTVERQEFILAASGLEETQIVRQPSANIATDVFNARKILDRMISLMAEIRVPAFLVDVYGDVVAANIIMLAFYVAPASMVETAAKIPGGFNSVRINFGRDLMERTRITDNWEQYALSSMRAFRENSLRYRAKPYFKYLMKAFRNPTEFPLFERYWKLVSSVEQDKELKLDYFSYEHINFGRLKYIASINTTITAFGNLLLVQNLPLDDHTDEVFTQLKQMAGSGVARLAPWPDKPMP
jgi:transcriptional regulator with XRE-family HTH domain